MMMSSESDQGAGRILEAETPDSTAVPVADKPNEIPFDGRDMSVALLWTLLADLLIFRARGFTGPAIFLAFVPILFLFLYPDMLRRGRARWTIGLCLIVAARLVWAGSALAVFSGIVLIVAIAMTAAGSVPLVLEGIVLAARSLFDGAIRLGQIHVRRHLGHEGRLPSGWLSVLLPVVAASVFGSIFVLANPDLLERVSTIVLEWFDDLYDWLTAFSLWEIPFCVVALLIGVGLFRPALPLLRFGSPDSMIRVGDGDAASQWYAAFRNTLITVIALFAVYLSFEWITLWRREFPDGFYYAGYAHQGAAWLTFALALATGMLSLIFRGSILNDRRLDSLKRLTWIWSIFNFLLALAVYNRLSIYVGYNGMTRMRTVGYFGITVVVIGFALVLCKIGRNRNFWWLIRSQLIALTLTVITYSIFPVDWVAHRYNVDRVAGGYLRPAVMIAVKPISDEGITPLLNLIECPDDTIRRGVLAILADRQASLAQAEPNHWTEFQGSRQWLAGQLSRYESYRNQRNDTNTSSGVSTSTIFIHGICFPRVVAVRD